MKAFGLSDTLAKRLFVLMWVALVASHFAGYAAVHGLLLWSGHAPSRSGMATLPSLPPTPGVPGPAGRDGVAPNLPTQVLLLDYGVRIAVIALAAWLGSRWLAAPMRQLALASRALNDSLAGAAPSASLDEHHGTREVREAARVFNLMAQRLRQQFRARGLMVAAMSHDLRTPLTRLRMRIDSMGADAELQKRSADDIQEMNRLIDTVLGVFRGDVLGEPEPLQDTAVHALLQSLVDDLAEQGFTVRLLPAEGDPARAIARCEPAALRRVLDNLLSNALRYAGAAEVSLHTTRDEVSIAVEDRGPGIDPAHLEAVFEPFYRLEASRNRATGGTGLGLYIARELTQRQGGRLLLLNRAGGGLRVELVVPRGGRRVRA
ncbi:MAG TPA: ATP-binding protein [Methylibium sp.]|uniref:sensor histidine kinase n=1 Tax=Methylibium sp. TaxID=2067992 RepID=UPI002DB6F4A4|nr:ATP-binding protein [Methylibium sp.]HEU4459757.1 ATP-binding protein [Methylibium sp.]